MVRNISVAWHAMGASVIGSAALLGAVLAQAATLEIDPVRIDLTARQKTGAITIRNSSDQPVTMEIKAVGWSQVDSRDVNVATRELLVSPPIATIPPLGSQIVRVALRRVPDPTRELAYRINLQEIPPPPASGSTGVQVALRVGLPVFVKSGNAKSAAKMEWSVLQKPDGNLLVALQNPGTAHIQISDFSLMLPGSNMLVASEQGSSYVLAGQGHEWILKPTFSETKPVPRLRLKVYTDAGDADQEIPLQSP
jgi:fimbrial chaperone protein